MTTEVGGNGSRRPRLAPRLAILACLCVAVFAVACGDDDSGGSGGEQAATAKESAGQKEATAFVEANAANPKEIPNGDKPLSKTPPEGKTIAYLQCGTPNCKDIGDAIEDAAGTLGWTVNRIPAGLTPEEVVRAWNTAIQTKPDAAAIAGFGRDVADQQIQEFSADGTPWVAESLQDPVGEAGLIASIDAVPDFEVAGQWLARWMVHESGDDVNAILFNSPAFTILKPYQDAMEAELKRLCPDCEFEVQNVNPADAGKKLPAQIVSAAQRAPDLNYVIPAWSDGAIGVPQALQASNLDDRVKLLTQGYGKVNLQQVQNGETPAFVPRSATMEGWMMVDALARHFVGDEVDQEVYSTVPRQYLTKDNLQEALGGEYGDYRYDAVLDYEDQYKSIWGLK